LTFLSLHHRISRSSIAWGCRAGIRAMPT
jgi:hypothetical protein